ncbi:MAG TPA: ankyrin repeat domain-containing protein [Vicinamibacterales bacterium]|nr:ankyrin repeat domain-containing protein [Vicinamibacterales bacterium]
MRRLLLALVVAAAATAAAFSAQADRVDFARDVQPIFRQHCYSCHGATIHQNGFRLDRRGDAMRGGTVSVIGRDSATSRLYMRIAGIGGYGAPMPPTGPLNPAQVDIIKRWIDQGADWPDALAGEAPPRPTPPLMHAVLNRDRAGIQRLLDQHADVNAVNEAGATALMWASMNLDAPTVTALIDHGANVNARSDDGRTALLIASRLHGALPIVTTLLDHGANPSEKAVGFGGDTNPLTEAAWAGEIETMRALVAKGADRTAAGFVALAFSLHANCRACFDLLLPALDRRAITFAPLVLIAPEDDGRMIRPLIDRGADVGFVDGAGRSVLMRLVASDTVPPDLVQAVIARGADVNYTNPKDGASALTFARLRGDTPVVRLLLKAGAHDANGPAAAPPPNQPLASFVSPRQAAERSVPLLQASDVTFMEKTGCVSCHDNSLTAMAVSLARSRGVRVDEEIAHSQVDAIAAYLDGWRERALQDNGIPGDHDTMSSILVGLSAEGFARNATTDAVALFLLRQQMPDGHWIIAAHRPPIESNDIQVTATCIRALQVYAPPARRAEYDAAVRRAAEWVQRATPHVTEERAYQLFAYGWTHAPTSRIQAAAKALVAEQRVDGGWSQLPTLASDAYATGEALVALEESGAMTPADPAYRKGVAFLLKTQLADGSWYVRSRAIAIQPYFESGFPHGRDQFISTAATGWATMALAAAIKPGS